MWGRATWWQRDLLGDLPSGSVHNPQVVIRGLVAPRGPVEGAGRPVQSAEAGGKPVDSGGQVH